MDYKYLTNTFSLGGRIKQLPKDFIVEEIGKDYKTSVKYFLDKEISPVDWDLIFSEKVEDKDYLLLDLEKHNVSTPKAITDLSRFLKISKSRIGYAGLKDKRSVSSQKISLFQPLKERISKFYFKDIRVYNPIWSKEKINIGDLKENNFIITIRKIENFSKEEIFKIINDCFSQIEEKGLLNYFGEQRFGGSREVTARVGKHLILKNYKEAVITYLTYPSEYESEEVKLARKNIKETEDFRKYSSFPSKTGYERQMLNHLINNPNDFLGAFKVLPKSMQYLFIHAYQSYLFNEIINIRVFRGYLDEIYGDKVIDGKIHLQLFGYDSKFLEGVAGEIEREVITREGIDFKHFKNKDYGVLSVKGDFRSFFTMPKNLKIIDVSLDDLNQEEIPGSLKATISFTLNKGEYATVLLREIIKKEDIG